MCELSIIFKPCDNSWRSGASGLTNNFNLTAGRQNILD